MATTSMLRSSVVEPESGIGTPARENASLNLGAEAPPTMSVVRGAPAGSSPVKVLLVICVGELRMKLSALSISILPGLPGRDPVANLPSGEPVVKENESAPPRVAPTAEQKKTNRIKFFIGVVVLMSGESWQNSRRPFSFYLRPFPTVP